MVGLQNGSAFDRGSEIAAQGAPQQVVGGGHWAHMQLLFPQLHAASKWEGGSGVRL